MGAGATAGVQSVIDETSLNEALAKLTVDDKIGFWTKVQESDAKAAIEANATLKDEFGKLSEENQAKFCDVIAKVMADPDAGAPFMALANEKGKAWCKEVMANMSPEEQAACESDPEKKKEWCDKYKAYVEEHLKALYQKAFERHDTDKSGKINKEQSAAFFKNYAAMGKDAMAWGMEQYAPCIALMLLGEGDHSDDDKKAKEGKVKAAIGPAIDAIFGDCAGKEDAVFALCDGGDGGIPFDNFLALFCDGSELQLKAAEALGMGQEQVMAKIKELAV